MENIYEKFKEMNKKRGQIRIPNDEELEWKEEQKRKQLNIKKQSR